MSCELCGGGDEWIKTCITHAGSRLLVCDLCYEENASVLVIVAGFGLMSQKGHGRQKHLGEFGDTWIWLSLLLWAVAIAIVLAVIVPSLHKVTTAISRQESVVSQTGKIAAAGGVVAIIFVVIVFLMSYQPGG